MQIKNSPCFAKNCEDLEEKIISFLSRLFAENEITRNTRLADLGLDSIDYIALGTFLFKTTNKWLDISQLHDESKIANLPSYLCILEEELFSTEQMVALDATQNYAYSAQLKDPEHNLYGYIIYFLRLKNVDLPRLEKAIAETLNNHFMLNSKIILKDKKHYFIPARPQEHVFFKGSWLFPWRNLSKLILKINSPRLVNIYLHKKKNHYYLIFSFHHIALDGWSHKIIQEEIFRRYAGLHSLQNKNSREEIAALNSLYKKSIKQAHTTHELTTLFNDIIPDEYNHLEHLFNGKTEVKHSCFILKRTEVDAYARAHRIEKQPYSVIVIFMFYQMICDAAKKNKLIIHTSLSNRFLPISGISELVSNFITGLPLFLDGANYPRQELAKYLDKVLKIYFKNMSYGGVFRAWLEENSLLRQYGSPYHLPHHVMLTYINNTSKIIYGNDSIVSNYVDWHNSTTHICSTGKNIFCDVHNLGAEFCIHIHSTMNVGLHQTMLNNFLTQYFPHASST